MKIPLPIRASTLKLFGSVVIFLLTASQSDAQSTCALATNLGTPGSSCSTTNGTLYNAATATPAGGCGGATATTTYSQWYRFTTGASQTSAVISVALTGSSLTTATTYVEIFNGTTCATITSLACQNVSTPLGVSGLTASTVYYVRVYVTTNPNTGVTNNWKFTICVVNPPANDNCAGANTVTTTATSYTLLYATSSGYSSFCSSTSAPDVWFKYTAGLKYPIITLSSLGTNFTNPIIEMYSGSCGSLTSLGCQSGTTYVPPGAGLTSGSTYYIRVTSSALTATPTSGTYTFKIAYSTPGASLTSTQTTTPSNVSPVVDYGKSYVNITKGNNGGTIEPGDTLEIRATFVVKGTTNGTAFNISFSDNVPANTTYIPSSLRTLTNEGKNYQVLGDVSTDGDGGTISGSAITINMGVGANATSGGFLSYRSKPSFYNSSCIIVAAYRVQVNPAATYGTKVPVGYGTVSFNNYSGTLTTDTFSADTIMLYPNYGICSNTVGTNAITSEFGGTFGSGKAKNRYASSKIPSSYTDTVFGPNAPQDYYYGISNNTSTGGLGYTTSNAWAYPDNSSTSHRVFTEEDIVGDHTNATNPLLGNPPADTVASSTGGYMAFINSAYRTDIAFLDTVSSLCPNTYYQYSAWFRNMCPKCGCDSNGVGASNAGYIPTALNDSSGVYPNLTFNINGYDYYTTGNILHTGQWIQKGFTYLADASTTSMIINIRNNAPGGGGNDWVIDDIGVATCAPNVALTPNKPDTLCMAADDTVRFKVSSYFNSYTYYAIQKSTDGGTTWSSPGVDTTGAGDTGTGTPVYNSSTSNYEYTATRYYQLNSTDTLTTYRLIVATTSGNLSNANCSQYATAQKIVVSTNCMLILPTNIILFKGKLDNGLANLQWVTTNETGNITYTVERSYDQVHYEAIGTLDGTAVEGLGATYNFTDPKIIEQSTYYRIHLVSGKYEKYSSLVMLSNSDISFDVQSVTNPFSDWLAFNMTSPDDGQSTFTLIDMYGRIVKQEKQSVTKGINSIRMYNLGSVAGGTYTLQVQYNDKIVSKRVIKLASN
ncbi:MAG: T9SS type A sorting domain-containing protein [Bacteroidetes bacterium]|nr:T9SS type A sorting domain-containing protein [Bacteroidota bacterium]